MQVRRVRSPDARLSTCDGGEEGQRTEARAVRRCGSDRHLVARVKSEPGRVPIVWALHVFAALEEAMSERAREAAALKV